MSTKFAQRPASFDIFFVSNGRQVLNAVSFIAEFGANMGIVPHVVGFYTEANVKEKAAIEEVCRGHNISFELVRLPRGAAFYSLAKVRKIEKIYEGVFARHTVSRIFLFNYNTHYTIAGALAAKNGYPIFYIEEGLSAYKPTADFLPPRSFPEVISSELIQDSFLGKIFLEYPYTLIASKVLQREFKFLLRCLYVPFDNDYVANKFSRLFGRLKSFRSFSSRIPKFDGVFGVFPEILMTKFPSKETVQFNYIKASFDQLPVWERDSVSDLPLTEKSVLYVDQNYKVPKEVIFDEISLWIAEQSFDFDAIFIKAHPRSDFSTIAFDRLRRRFPHLNLKLLSDVNTSAEFIPALTKCRTVFGIASTTLVYASSVCPDVVCYSFYRRVLKRLAPRTAVAKTVADHGHIFDQFPHVKVV